MEEILFSLNKLSEALSGSRKEEAIARLTTVLESIQKEIDWTLNSDVELRAAKEYFSRLLLAVNTATAEQMMYLSEDVLEVFKEVKSLNARRCSHKKVGEY